MQSVTTDTLGATRLIGLVLAAATLIAASHISFASFEAASPGSDLAPVGGAESLITLIQGEETILWTAVNSVVTKVTTIGWPVSDGTHELGGALVIDNVAGANTGIVDFGEKPMSMDFELAG